jgi:hypothetical protein
MASSLLSIINSVVNFWQQHRLWEEHDMAKGSLKGIGVLVVVLGLLSGGVMAFWETADGDGTMSAKVLNPNGKEIGVMVNGQFRPSPTAVDSLSLVPCVPTIDNAPIWGFCKDGFYFSHIFQYRQYKSAKRALARYTGPVVIEVGGQQNQSFLQDGWLR